MAVFDAIVVGSGMTGGIAAKELCEAGLKTLVLERGPNVVHGEYPTEFIDPWDMDFRGYGDRKSQTEVPDMSLEGNGHDVQARSDYTAHWYAKSSDAPYQTPDGKPFKWIRGHHVGGRSIMWSRHTPRLGPLDFEANAIDGHGVPWPVTYDDIAPWYDYIESYIGVQGMYEGNDQIPDGKFTKPFDLTVVEEHIREGIKRDFGRTLTIGRNANLTEERENRGLCQARDQCERGCSWAGYYSSVGVSLADAERTGNMTLLPDSRVVRLIHDDEAKKITGVEVYDMKTGTRQVYEAKIVFLCASAFSSVQILMSSTSDAHPNGLGGNSGVLGRYVMDHPRASSVRAIMPGFTDVLPRGRRPSYSIILPFKNTTRREYDEAGFYRSYMMVVSANRLGWGRGMITAGIGGEFKDALGKPGPWVAGVECFGECLPYETNTLSLDHNNLDKEGLPQLNISIDFGENEQKQMEDAEKEGKMMMEAVGALVVGTSSELSTPGQVIHEMGGAPMGNDPMRSVLNANNQHHDASNLYVTDGAFMNSSAFQNPSLTYMAFTARAAQHAIKQIKSGALS